MLALQSTLLLLASGLLANAVPTESQPKARNGPSLSVPSTWRQTSTKLSKSQRGTIASNAMNKMLTLGGSDEFLAGLSYWQTANVWSALILKDRYAGTTEYKAKALSALNSTFTKYHNFRQNTFNDDTLWWATAATYAYETHKDKSALAWAEASWANVLPYQIKGTSAPGLKDSTWHSTCNGTTAVGGVFEMERATDLGTNAIVTGLFGTLSARLYAETKSEKYLDAAEKSFAYIRNHMYNSTTDLVYDGFGIGTYMFTYNAAKYVEGLAVLGAATGKFEYTDAAIATANAGMKVAHWQKDDGIIREMSGNVHDKNNDGWGFKAVWVRALAELYRLYPRHHALQTLIHSFINVQANALIELGSNTKNDKADEFGGSWQGPFDKMYSWTQLPALDALGAFVLVG